MTEAEGAHGGLSRALLAAEQAAILGQLAEGVILTDTAGRITYVNEAAARLHGVRQLDVGPGDYASAYQLLTEDGQPYAPGRLPLARAVLDGEVVADARWRIRRADGTEVIAQGSARPILDGDGRPLGAVLTMHDDTARVQAEQALREESQALETLNRVGSTVASELELERIVQTVTDAGVALIGASMGAFFYNTTNEAGESMLLYTLSGVDRHAFDRYPMPRTSVLFRPTLAGESLVRCDDVLLDPRYGKSPPYHGLPPGHPPVRSYLAVPVVSRSGRVLGGLFFGHPEPGRFSLRHERLMVGIAAHAAIAIDNANLYAVAQREIDERRAAEDRLRELNETLEQRVEARTRERDRAWKHSRDLQAVVDEHGYFLQVSDAWSTVLGWQAADVVGHRAYEFVHPDDRPAGERPFFANLAKGPAFENRMRHRDGSYRCISWVASQDEDTIYASGRDVSEQKEQAQALAKAEAALRQSQKMEAVGHLTGGIAHDFNNMLAVVIGSLDLLKRRLPEGSAERRHADNAMEAADRAATLTQRLLAFARQQPLNPQPLDANALVAGMYELLRHAIGADIRLEVVLAQGLWPTLVDANQLENVVLNLAVNARDAMRGGGRLAIETANATLDRRYAASHPDMEAGEYVSITVSDTGVGMAPEVAARAFDPFFTTKQAGQGTGLGLSQVYGFVRQSGGHVTIYSEPGRGTSVKVYLPRMSGKMNAPEAGISAPPLPVGRQELILLVDDEPAVRQVNAEALRELGYRVLQADGAEAALDMLDTHPEIALLFTDVVMPGTDGRRLATEARRRRPGLKVLFTTGYSPAATRHNGTLEEDAPLLGKPYTLDELGRKLRQVLEGA
ncbi:PAS domain S-box protein [Frateuria terrea]|uniref:histidine kinase n=1 Tax=Frateuria terrea TaxID=529704 RepID=A0A1H6QRK0_9GAMM|nr:PAS domain S-box protein [Frateuria terrea]SEI41865.1 PAS domain S-box-containing protein [Frateuria terrea]SFP07177.1 PAS domain S-box-containing protein [Frateuria terrea]